MKRKLISKVMVILLGVIVFTTSCQKEEVATPIKEKVAEEKIEGLDQLIEQADEEFVNSEYAVDEEAGTIFISNDGLPDAYALDASSIRNFSSTASSVSGNNQLINCLRRVSPNQRQMALLKQALSDYNDCKNAVMRRYKLALDQINKDAMSKMRRYRHALQNGHISKAQYKRLVNQLKNEVQTKKTKLAKSVRLSVMKCYRTLLQGIHKILTPDQWKRFMYCKNGNVRK
jgi:transcription antitermination factor NusG